MVITQVLILRKLDKKNSLNSEANRTALFPAEAGALFRPFKWQQKQIERC